MNQSLAKLQSGPRQSFPVFFLLFLQKLLARIKKKTIFKLFWLELYGSHAAEAEFIVFLNFCS
jgi:hypothetical protein